MYITKKILSLLFLPLIGAAGFVLLFFVMLNGPQRTQIFSDMLSSVPIAKNFVSKHYDSHLSITAIEDSSFLKTVFFSVDYLGSVQNSSGERYLAVYPFEVEAGIELENTIITTSEEESDGIRKITIELPQPEILPPDLDEKKGILVIRDDLDADHEYALRPLKSSFEKLAADYALKHGIMEKALENAEHFFHQFWESVYDEVEVITAYEPKTTYFSAYDLNHLPLSFSVSNLNFAYEFKPLNTFEPVCARFTRNNSAIDTGYVGEYRQSYQQLFDLVAAESGTLLALKFIDPNEPLGNGVVCTYGQHGGTCYVMKQGNLFYLDHRAVDSEMVKNSLADMFYLSFSAQMASDRQFDQQYLDFHRLLYRARQDLNNARYANLENAAQSMVQLDSESESGKWVKAVAQTFNTSAKDATVGQQNLDLMLHLYRIVKNDALQELDPVTIDMVLNTIKLKKHHEFKYDFLSYLIVNQKQIGLDDQQVNGYIDTLIQDGHLSYEILKNVTTDQLAQLLKAKIEKIRTQKIAKGAGPGFLLFCNENQFKGKPQTTSSELVYYDQKSLENVFGEGKETVVRNLKKVLSTKGISLDPEKHLVVVLSRKSFSFFTFYDAFVFQEDRFILYRDINDDYDPEDFTFMRYSAMNPGNDEVKIADKEYHNATLYELLDQLHDISKKSSKGTRDRIYAHLKNQIIAETNKFLAAPALPGNGYRFFHTAKTKP